MRQTVGNEMLCFLSRKKMLEMQIALEKRGISMVDLEKEFTKDDSRFN